MALLKMAGLKMTGLSGVLRVLAVAVLVAVGQPTTDPVWLLMRVVSSALLVTCVVVLLEAAQGCLVCALRGGGGSQGRVLHHDQRPGDRS